MITTSSVHKLLKFGQAQLRVADVRSTQLGNGLKPGQGHVQIKFGQNGPHHVFHTFLSADRESVYVWPSEEASMSAQGKSLHR